MTLDEIQTMTAGIAPIIQEYVARETAPLLTRIAALDAEVVALRQAAKQPDLAPALDQATAPLLKRIDDLETQLAGLPVPRDGIDGKDADPEFVRLLVVDAVSKLPAAKDGAPGEKGEDGRDGKDGAPGANGRDADPVDMVTLRAEIAEAAAAIPRAKDGIDGADGKDGAPGKDADPEAILRMVAEAVKAIPPPKDGRDGEAGQTGERGEAGPQGERGADGTNGRDGKDAEPITREMILDAIRADETIIGEAVQRYISANPPASGKDGAPGERGADGINGRDGADGLSGKDGTDGTNGKDGADGLNGRDADMGQIEAAVEKFKAVEERVERMAQAIPKSTLVDQEGVLVQIMANGDTAALGKVRGEKGDPGQDGKDGAPGRDAFALEGFDSEVRDGGRTLVLSFETGETRHTVEHQLDVMIYRGGFVEGREYTPGDVVTRGGSMWVCVRGGSDRPGDTDAWQLAVRRGSRGRDGGALVSPPEGD